MNGIIGLSIAVVVLLLFGLTSSGEGGACRVSAHAGETVSTGLCYADRKPGGCSNRCRMLALRGGADAEEAAAAEDDDDKDDGDKENTKFVERVFKRCQPEEVIESTDYISKRLRAEALVGSGRCDVKVGAGTVEVRYGDESKDPDQEAEKVMEEFGQDDWQKCTPIERMRRELHDRMEHENSLGRDFFDAILQRNFSAAYALLEQGADPNWRHPLHHLNTALHRVAASGETDTVGFLLDNGASVHVMNLFGDTPIMASAGGAGLEPIHGINKDEWSRSWKGGEKLTLEVERWSGDLYRVSKMLLDGGAVLQHCNNYSNTPLHKVSMDRIGIYVHARLPARHCCSTSPPGV